MQEENGDYTINVHELHPVLESGIGRITRIEDHALFINNYVIVHAETVKNNLTAYPVGTLVDYRAIRNDGGYKWQYRCYSMVPVGEEREKAINPDFQGALEQFASLGANKRGIFIDNRDITFTFLDTALGTTEKQTRCVKLMNVTKKDQKLINLTINRDYIDREDQFTILEPDFAEGPITIKSQQSINVIIEASCKQLGECFFYLSIAVCWCIGFCLDFVTILECKFY